MEDSKVGAIEGFIGTFIKPNRTMKKIVFRPVYGIPLLCAAILSGLNTYVNFDLFFNEAYKILINSAPDIDQSAAVTGVIAALGVSIVAGIVITIATWMILSGFLVMITRNFGGTTDFKEMRAITIHSYYIYLVSVVIQTVATFISGNATKVFGLNLLALFPNVTDLAIKTLLQSIDLISFWQYAVIAVGISHIEDMDRKKAITVVVITFALKVVIGVLFSLLTQKGM